MSYVETAWSHASIPAELANVRPLGDFCLVRMLPEEEMHRNLIWLPQFSGAHADRQLRPTLPSIGEVVAAGPGDRRHEWACSACMTMEYTTLTSSPKCPDCGGPMGYIESSRHPMHVKPGDLIKYWPRPANEQVINEETFQIIHEEQDILGVIENG